jgi:hypothetical protein
MTRDRNDPPGHPRAQDRLRAFLREREELGSPLSEREQEEFARLFERLVTPGLEATPDGWAEAALDYLRGPERPAGSTRRWDGVAAPLRAVSDAAERVRRGASRLKGLLVFDTALAPVPGTRTAEPARARQMLFAYTIGKLYLQIAPEESGARLHGQFVPADPTDFPEGRSITALADETPTRAVVQVNGEFELTLPTGTVVDLELRWGEKELVIERLRV